MELVAALARLGAAAAEAALVSARLVPRCMDLFLQYPFNNMLHHQVCSLEPCTLSTQLMAKTARKERFNLIW